LDVFGSFFGAAAADYFVCQLSEARARFSPAGLNCFVFLTPRATAAGPLAMPMPIKALYFREVTRRASPLRWQRFWNHGEREIF
jgi:hypothetical protein